MNLYQKIGNDIRAAIIKSKLKPGDKILSISEIKEKYKVSHITALRVYKELSAEGLIAGRHGQGYFVCDQTPKPQKIFGRFACFTRPMRPLRESDNYFNEINIGIQTESRNRRIDLILPSSTVLLKGYIPSPEMLEELKKAMFACADLVDGYILDERIPDEVIKEVTEKTKKPAVMINRRTELPINMVYPDNKSLLETLLGMGRRMGYTQFVFCAQGSLSMYLHADYNSFSRDTEFLKMAVDDHYELLEDCLRIPRDAYLKKINDAYLKHRQKGRVLLICTTDILAADLILRFCSNGQTPDDLGIAGCDGLAVGKYSSPTISSMKIDTYAIGEKAVEILQNSVNGLDSYMPSEILVPAVFEPGESMNWK